VIPCSSRRERVVLNQAVASHRSSGKTESSVGVYALRGEGRTAIERRFALPGPQGHIYHILVLYCTYQWHLSYFVEVETAEQESAATAGRARKKLRSARSVVVVSQLMFQPPNLRVYRFSLTPQFQPTTSNHFVAMDSQQNLPRLPDYVKFRVLIIGRANAGKTSILQRVCDTTESPEIYRRGKSGNDNLVRSRYHQRVRSHHLVRLNSSLPWRLDRLILSL
jgi:hypothetical protein